MTVLNKELCLKIRTKILDGQKYIDIRDDLDIAKGTWDSWYWENKEIPGLDQAFFRDMVNNAKKERWMSKVDRNIDDYLDLDEISTNSMNEMVFDTNIARLKLDVTKYIGDRIGKDEGFTTRVENINDTKLTVEELPPERIAQIKNALRD